MKKSIIALGIVSVLLYVMVLVVSPDINTVITVIAGMLSALPFLAIVVFRARFPSLERRFRWFNMIPLYAIFLVIPVVFAIILFIQGKLSIPLIIVMVSLTFSFFYAFLNIPLAIYHKHEEIEMAKKPPTYYPSISILIPAYNEEKCIAGAIETLLDAYYPDKEIIVIDDGSTDNTYQIAQSYARKGVKIIQRPNGGKAAALNHGLQFAHGEIIVCVDADSMVTRGGIAELVRRFEDPGVAAVAGNIKVLNRNKLITAIQALEYIFDINIARRGLDTFDAVIVVPGCLGAFRAEALRAIGGWDVETVVEDFDTTIKLSKGGAFDFNSMEKELKTATVRLQEPDFAVATKGLKIGKVIQASSAATAYTEAPETVRGLWQQRLRWYRGNWQAMLKHKDAFSNSRFRALYTVGFPYVLISLLFIPVGMVLITVTAIIAILDGDGISLLFIFGVFTLLQFLISALAIELDDEDLKLALCSPLFVLGYKHFLDIIKLKALFDVLTKKKVGWDKLYRLGLYQKGLTKRNLVAERQGSQLPSGTASVP